MGAAYSKQRRWSSGPLQRIGLISLSDPPRFDSAALIQELGALGVRTVMVTGDAPGTAVIVAKAVQLKEGLHGDAI